MMNVMIASVDQETIHSKEKRRNQREFQYRRRIMEDEEFKKLRHRFWRLGKERRFTVIKKMGFQAIEPYSGMDLSAEKTQREMLFHAKIHGRESELVTFIEEQEALITAEEESASYLKEPRPTEFPPSKEEMEERKYVPGTKKDI